MRALHLSIAHIRTTVRRVGMFAAALALIVAVQACVLPSFAFAASATAVATPTSDGAVITGTVTGLTSTTGVSVSYGTTTAMLQNKYVTFSNATDYTVTLSGLTGVVYYQIYNQVDNADLTSVLNFTVDPKAGTSTGGGTSGSPVTPGTGTATTTTTDKSVTIKGTGDARGGKLVTILYEKAGATGNPLEYGTSINTAGYFSVTIGNLTPATTYSYWVKAMDGSYITNEQQFTTLTTAAYTEAEKDNDIAKASAYFNASGDSATVQVMVTGMYGPDSVVIKYGTKKDALDGSAIILWDGTMDGPNGAGFAGTLYDLMPLTTYYYSVFSSYDDAKITPTFGPDRITKLPVPSFKTSAGKSTDVYRFGVVLELTAAKITATTAEISGRVALATNTLDVVIDTDNDGTYDYRNSPTVSSDRTFKFTVTNLVPGHVYGFIATKKGDASVLLTMRKAFKTTGITARPYISELSDKSVTIAVEFSDGIRNPGVIYGLDAGHFSAPVTLAKNAEGVYTAELTGLTPDTTYAYQIVGEDNGKTIEYTNPASFLTAREATTPPEVPRITDDSSGGEVTTYASGSLVQCIGGIISSKAEEDADHKIGQQGCSFKDLMKLIERIIDFLLFLVAPIIATCVVLYAGVLILTSGGSAEKISQAKGMFMKAIIGLALAMGAWIIVKFVLVTLGYDDTIFAHFY